MPAASIADNLSPTDLVQAALARPRNSFALLYGDTQLLLIRLPPGSEDLAEGLTTTAPQAGSGTPIKATLPTIDFHTQMANAASLAALGSAGRGRGAMDATALRGMIAACPHFVVPLRKREDVGTLSADRITFGRARNKDIVLRHGSVSKFHGWFQIDDSGKFCIADAGSKNGIRINDIAVAPRELFQVELGKPLKIGSLDAFLCSADSLWTALHT